jgi:ubiquinone/menaquinone biosynthesis C-methylase UbiE
LCRWMVLFQSSGPAHLILRERPVRHRGWQKTVCHGEQDKDKPGPYATVTTVEYDAIADVYDETRRPLDRVTLLGIKQGLVARGCRSILEIGVGTGRVSVPLMKEGFEMTGLDISAKMMERARSKGHGNLVLGDGVRPPFREGSFDAVVLAHVIHLIEDPCGLVNEAAKVAKVGVYALIRKRDENRAWFPFFGTADGGSPEEAQKAMDEMRASFRKIAAKYGWTWDRSRPRNWGREKELLAGCPPDELGVISDVVVTEGIEERIDRVRKGAFGFTSTMPPEMREEIIAEMLRRTPRAGPRHQVYQLAFWDSKKTQVGPRAAAFPGPGGRGRLP